MMRTTTAGLAAGLLLMASLAAADDPGTAEARPSDVDRAGGPPSGDGTDLFGPLEDSPVERAARAKQSLDVWGPRIIESGRRLNEQMERGDLKNLAERQYAVESAKALVGDLIDWGRALQRAEERFRDDQQMYQRVLVEASPTFDRLAEHYREKAGRLKTDLMRQRYLDLADMSRRRADGLRTLSEGIEKRAESVTEKMEMIDESLAYLQDLEQFLDTVPDHTAGAEMQQFIESLDSYLDALGSAVDQIQQLSRELDKADREIDQGRSRKTEAIEARLSPTAPPSGTYPVAVRFEERVAAPEPPQWRSEANRRDDRLAALERRLGVD